MKSDPRKYFSETILPCHRRMYAAALAITGNVDDSSDIVQTAMLRIWEIVKDGHYIENPMSYCLSAVRNICLTEIKRSKMSVSIENNTDRASENSSTETAIELVEVSKAICRLPESERRALEMRAYAGCSAEEIAESLGTTSANARKILSRGRKKLRLFFTK